jgi:hypothetical protein
MRPIRATDGVNVAYSLEEERGHVTGRAIRRYQMLVRVSTFGADHAAAFPSHTLAARTFEEVSDVVSALHQHIVTQASARASDRVVRKAIARKRLRSSVRVIGRTARAFAAGTPAILCRFRVPKTNGDRALVSAARGFAHHARQLATVFVAHELPPTFLVDLDGEIAALERATGDYAAIRQAGVAATAGVDTVLARGLAMVRRLDAIVANVFRGDSAMLAAWQLARAQQIP